MSGEDRKKYHRRFLLYGKQFNPIRQHPLGTNKKRNQIIAPSSPLTGTAFIEYACPCYPYHKPYPQRFPLNSTGRKKARFPFQGAGFLEKIGTLTNFPSNSPRNSTTTG